MPLFESLAPGGIIAVCKPSSIVGGLAMPVYVYRCDACGATFERKQCVTEGPLKDCPECDGHVRRVIQPIGIVFKGSGFYVTDHRSHSATTEPTGTSSDSSAKSSPSSETRGPTSTNGGGASGNSA